MNWLDLISPLIDSHCLLLEGLPPANTPNRRMITDLRYIRKLPMRCLSELSQRACYPADTAVLTVNHCCRAWSFDMHRTHVESNRWGATPLGDLKCGYMPSALSSRNLSQVINRYIRLTKGYFGLAPSGYIGSKLCDRDGPAVS